LPARKALYWTIFWILIAIVFNIGVYFELGEQRAIEFFTGYLIEEFLSVDNLFVFLILFNYFKIPPHHQRKVLNWGIAGVIVLRGLFIFAGISLITQFYFILYIFGAILIISGYRMTFTEVKNVQPERNKVLMIFKKFFRTTHETQGSRFLIKKDGKSYATHLLVCLIVIESTDLVFAIDSIPAIFAITNHPFIIFTSNILAVLGLRSIYFLLSIISGKFEYVKKGVGIILFYVGTKMLLPLVFPELHIPAFVSLIVILVILFISALVSIFIKRKINVKIG
jgi:tellurite resistance protein TerC